MNVREYLFRRKNRCVGRLLAQLEREVFPQLSSSAVDRARFLVKSRIGDYHCEVLDALDDGSDILYNAVAMELRDRLNDHAGS